MQQKLVKMQGRCCDSKGRAGWSPREEDASPFPSAKFLKFFMVVSFQHCCLMAPNNFHCNSAEQTNELF